MRRSLKCFGLTFVIIICYLLFHPDRHAKYYSYIHDDRILAHTVANFEYSKRVNYNTSPCNYDEILANMSELFNIKDLALNNYNQILPGGEYFPLDCTPRYSTAVIVCYRNRPQQLEIFLNYIHSYLSKQKLHYRIFLAEQNNSEPFNRALMLNYGSLVAMNYSFPCLVLHDVDLLPINSGNLYVCTNLPRHMSCSIDTMRFNLPYNEIVGGVLSIQSMQFKMINGMSNEYYGWGGEDDDLYRRMTSKKLHPIRFSPWISRYIMLKHKHETPSPHRYQILADSLKRQFSDGLNTLTAKYEVKLKPLYTHVIVN